MADYFPLISRAISALDPNTPQRREAIYARARDALERQLRGLDPPIPENDLKRERAVLDDTIRRVETQYAAPPTPSAPTVTSAVDPLPATPKPDAAPPAELVAPYVAEPDPAPVETVVPVQRPKVVTGATRGFSSDFRKMTALVVAIPVVILIAVAAYFLRDDPARFSPETAGAQADAGAAPPRKTGGRLDGTGGAGPVTGPTRPVAPANDATTIPVASRALFFEESPDNPQGVQSDGIVVWRMENVAGGPGRPLTSAVRGSVTVSKANIGLELVIKKNVDSALPASHTVEVVFKPEAGRDGIKDLGPIEARTQENQPGFALQGAMVPIGVNLFLVGLDNSETVIQKNVDAMRETKWFAFQFRTVKGRLGAVLIEKGLTGDKVFRDALDQWR